MNKEIPKKKLEELALLVLDSDGVLIPRGTKISQKYEGDNFEVNFSTTVITDRLARKIKKLSKKIRIYISSGRSMVYLQAMYSRIAGSVDLVAENGSVMFDGNIFRQFFSFPNDYFNLLAKIKEEVGGLPILGFEPKQFILTIHCEKDMRRVRSVVRKLDKEKYLKIMWNGEAFDIQHKMLSKGDMLNYSGYEQNEIIAIGDRVNDKEMVEMAGVGVSADRNKLPAEYWVEGDKMGGEILIDYLLEKL